jgi:adenylylsulfate kinase
MILIVSLETIAMSENIVKHNFSLGRSERENKLGQKGCVIWLTGLSGSGKSTIANLAEELLFNSGKMVTVLDGDSVRSGLCNNLGFSQEDRRENLRRIAEVAKLNTENAIITVCCFIAPLKEQRQMISEILGDDIKWVFVDTSLETCEARDPKWLYKKARAGEIKDFTGISSPYEKPENADLVLSEDLTIEQAASKVIDLLGK